LLRTLTDEVATTVAVVEGSQHRSAEQVSIDRSRFRAAYTSLVNSRRRFWR
jgi:hypothetical protein